MNILLSLVTLDFCYSDDCENLPAKIYSCFQQTTFTAFPQNSHIY